MSSGMSAGAGTALAALINAGAGMYAGYQSGKSSWKNTKRSAYLNYALNQASLRESPTNARQGLEKAGFNPILAATSGNTVPTLSGINSNGGDFSGLSDVGSSAVNAYKTFALEKQGMTNQTNETNARIGLMNEQAQTEEAKRIQMEFQNAMTDVETHLKQKDLDWYDRKAYSEIYELMQRAENYRAVQSIMSFNAQTERQNSLTNAKNAETNAINAKTNIGRAVGAGVAGALGLSFGAGALGKGKYLKGAVKGARNLGKNGFHSSLAKYFTTLH